VLHVQFDLGVMNGTYTYKEFVGVFVHFSCALQLRNYTAIETEAF
jgi:hypothetical protein